MGAALSEQSQAGPTGETLLQVSGLAYDYSGVSAVSDCSLELPRGKITALIGGNGAGKTTSVKMIAGALRPRSGRIILDGQDITNIPAYQTVELGIALVPEGRLVFQHLTVCENLVLSGHVRRARERCQQNLERVFDLFPRLKERQGQNAGSLSGGEQQMLAIGRGLMTMPRILVLDEPSLGLSPILVSQVFSLVRKLNEEGISVLLVEQNVHHTLAIADYAYVLEKGRVVQKGEGQALLKNPNVKEAYLGLA
ncbi:ABC transporter ATP-binding protein [Chelativorans sp. YIM 93263]|uniref:ABC transporter ATP-binding protein n=1 Tax=Chelativorans sp. YIM 93263 TaxID=2906648 RepID=UPI002379344A|nr:ABC transporter ATP-binding protein [Chelativorans sp. YIM 93263]